MGIPSFYRTLVKNNPKLISEHNGGKPSVLALDLNCAIYHCLSKLQKKTPYVATNRIEFENALIQSVVLYIVKLRDHVQPSDLLYVAVDGVVPMAKIRQQRMRRFKSVWVSAEESAIKGTDSAGWDRNAITPGTEFMDRLCERLSTWAKSSPKTVVSGVRESGEGEQKIMSYLRSHTPKGPIVVYGLDADLIVLCLWHFATYEWSFQLLREDVEMKGGVKLNAFGEETLLYFNIDMLASIIVSRWSVTIQDYVGAMSFLGNDFLPHGLTLCIREEGIEKLMMLLEKEAGLVYKNTNGVWTYNVTTLQKIITEVANMEEKWLLSGLIKKLKMSAHGYTKPGAEPQSDVEKALSIMNSLPLNWKVERCLASKGEEGWFLKDDWQANYYNEFLWGAKPADVVKAWLKGIQWILNYYTGEPVDHLWYYSWYLPPLFKDIQVETLCKPTAVEANPIEPIVQLIMVLPIESYALLPSNLRSLPFSKPEYYPTKWTFFSAGRRQLWECEPMIPMLPYHVVMKKLKDINKN